MLLIYLNEKEVKKMRRSLILTVLAAVALTLLFGSACFAGVTSDPNCCPDGSIAAINPVQVYVYDGKTNLPIRGAKVVISGPGTVVTPSSYNVKDYTNSKGYTGIYTGLNQLGDYYADVTFTGRDPVRQLIKIENIERLCDPILISIPLIKCERSLEVCVYDVDTSNPISGSTVTVKSTTSSYTATKNTASSGCMLVNPISAGDYTITAAAAGYIPATPATVTITNECKVFQIRIGLKCVPSMKVCVYDQDNPATPISGATVTIARSGGTSATMGTNSGGCATFANLTTGIYTINASATGYEAADPVNVTLTSEPGSCQKEVKLYLKKEPCIASSIKVCLHDQNNPGTTPSGLVSITKDGGEPVILATAGGCATFANLSSGTYTVYVNATGFKPAESVKVTLVQGDCQKRIDLYLQRKTCEGDRSLQVYVYNENGNPINGAKVVITSGNFSETVMTDATGFTPLVKGSLADGLYTATVTATNYAPGSTEGNFEPGNCGKLSLKVQLKDSCNDCVNQGTIQVKVRDITSGTFIRGAKVCITGPGGYNVTDYTNSRGSTSLLGGASILGVYNVEVTKTGYKVGTGTIDINYPSTSNRVITVYLAKQ